MSDFILSSNYFKSNASELGSSSESSSLHDQIDDSFIEDLLIIQRHMDIIQRNKDAFYKKDGTISKRRRSDYSRGPKTKKSDDPWATVPFLQLVSDPNVDDPSHRQGKEFRRLFRIPFLVFKELLHHCKETGDPIFCYPEYHFTGESNIPIELKIFAVLRVLAGGLMFKDGSMIAQYMSEGTLNKFFKEFCAIFRNKFEHQYIKVLEGDDFLRSSNIYARLGLPGAVGSIDDTFVGPWDGCPSNLQNVMKGDKGKGLLYEVVVDHCRRCLSVEGGYFGTVNDKCSVKYSKIVKALKNNEFYQEYSYKIRTGDGLNDFIELSSYYLISDGGYLDWPCIICGFPPDADPLKFKFTDWIESVRKDVECFFGILKRRFRWLKCPTNIQEKCDIDNAFVTCCIINNMILDHDGLDRLWEDNVNWKTLSPNDDDEDVNDSDNDYDTDIETQSYGPVEQENNILEPITVGSLVDPDDIIDHDRASTSKLRYLLANHLHRVYKRRELQWPRTRLEIHKKYNIIPRINFPFGEEIVEEFWK